MTFSLQVNKVEGEEEAEEEEEGWDERDRWSV